MIVTVYSHPPAFPATDQHPNATRYRVGVHYVDAVGDQPSEQEVSAFLTPPPAEDEVTRLRAQLAEIQAALDRLRQAVE